VIAKSINVKTGCILFDANDTKMKRVEKSTLRENMRHKSMTEYNALMKSGKLKVEDKKVCNKDDNNIPNNSV